MKHIKKMIGSLLFLAISISSCNSQPSQIQTPTDTLPIHIQRFDKALLQFIETQDTALEQELLKEYPAMLDIVGKGQPALKKDRLKRQACIERAAAPVKPLPRGSGLCLIASGKVQKPGDKRAHRL